MKKYCHIGFAADTENGLVVPVVRDVWSKGIAQIGAQCADLAKKAAQTGKQGADLVNHLVDSASSAADKAKKLVPVP